MSSAEALFQAIANDDLETVRQAIQSGSVDINAKHQIATSEIGSTKSMSALMFAAFNSHSDVARLLLTESNADVNDLHDEIEGGMAPLHFAAKYGDFDIAHVLVDSGRCDLELKDKTYGRTALGMAAINGRYQMVNYLLEKGANPNVIDATGRAVLDLAAAQRDQMKELLFKYGAKRSEQKRMSLVEVKTQLKRSSVPTMTPHQDEGSADANAGDDSGSEHACNYSDYDDEQN